MRSASRETSKPEDAGPFVEPGEPEVGPVKGDLVERVEPSAHKGEAHVEVDLDAAKRLYDLRRETEIPQHGFLLMIVRSRDLDCDRRQRLRRNHERDRAALQILLTAHGVSP